MLCLILLVDVDVGISGLKVLRKSNDAWIEF